MNRVDDCVSGGSSAPYLKAVCKTEVSDAALGLTVDDDSPIEHPVHCRGLCFPKCLLNVGGVHCEQLRQISSSGPAREWTPASQRGAQPNLLRQHLGRCLWREFALAWGHRNCLVPTFSVDKKVGGIETEPHEVLASPAFLPQFTSGCSCKRTGNTPRSLFFAAQTDTLLLRSCISELKARMKQKEAIRFRFDFLSSSQQLRWRKSEFDSCPSIDCTFGIALHSGRINR